MKNRFIVGLESVLIFMSLTISVDGQVTESRYRLPSEIAALNGELTKAGSSQPAHTPKLGLLLKRRAESLLALIQFDPASAQSLWLPPKTVAQLRKIVPDAVLETQGTWDGVLEAAVADDFENHRSRTQWYLRTASQRLEVHFLDPGVRRVGDTVAVTGNMIAGHLAAASVGSPKHTVHDATRNEANVSQECGTVGPQNIAVLMVTLPSHPSFPAAITPATAYQGFFGSASDKHATDSLSGYWREMSYGRTSATGDVFGPFALGQDYTCDQTEDILNAAIQAADATVDFTKYTRIVLLFPVSGCASYAGMDTLGCRNVVSPSKGSLQASVGWFPVLSNYNVNIPLYVHEMGHALGLGHSSTADYDHVPLGDPQVSGSTVEYGDLFSLMGYPYNGFGFSGQYTAEHKSLTLHWLKPGDYQEVRSSGTFGLKPYESPTGLRALRILRDQSFDSWLWLEYRQPIGDVDSSLLGMPGSNVFNGALIHYEDLRLPAPTSFLLDFNPVAAPNDFHNAAMTPGQVWSDPYSPLTLAVNQADSNGLSVTVQYGQRPPTLHILKTHDGVFLQGQSGAVYTLTVSNDTSAGATVGSVSVVESVPPNLTLVAMNGPGWECSSKACTRNDALAPGDSYPSIRATVNVSIDAPPLITNIVSVSSGVATATASDATVVVSNSSVIPAGSFAHLASGGGWESTLTLVNLGSTQADVVLNVHADDGSPLALHFDFPQRPGESAVLSPALVTTIPGHAVLLLDSQQGTGPQAQSASAELLASGTVSGFEVFRYLPSGQQAVVPIETRNAPSYLLPFDNTSGLATGFAVANISPEPATIPVVLRDDMGSQIGAATVQVPAVGHDSFMLADSAKGFTATAGRRGTAEFKTPPGGRIAIVGLRVNGKALTTLPVLAQVSPGGGSMAHVAVNGGWQTVFTLVNTGASASTTAIGFFDDDGIPLQLPVLFPQTGATDLTAEIARTLAPGATLLISTQGQDSAAAVTGSAHLTSAGSVSGFAVFRYNPTAQEAVVPLEARDSKAYVLAFDNSKGFATGLAIANLSTQSATVPVSVRDDTGATLSNGTISISANGHKSFMLTDQQLGYPQTLNARGTIEFGSPTGGRISVLGIRATTAGVITTIPALAK